MIQHQVERDYTTGWVLPLHPSDDNLDTIEERVKTGISEWIVRAALAGTNEVEIVAGVCQQLNSAGVSLVRSSVSTSLLDPTLDGRAVRWNRDQGALEEAFPRTDDAKANDDWRRSPFFFMIENEQLFLRRRLDATYRRGEFPILDGFQDQGVTDYLAFAERVGESVRMGEGEGMVSSWTTDAPAGFSEGKPGGVHIRLCKNALALSVPEIQPLRSRHIRFFLIGSGSDDLRN